MMDLGALFFGSEGRGLCEVEGEGNGFYIPGDSFAIMS